MRKVRNSLPPTPIPVPREHPVQRRRRSLSPSRRAIVERLRGQPEPVAIHAIAMVTRLHENTVREHLDGLIALGLVTRVRSAPAGRGRPAWLYRHVEEDESRSPLTQRGYEVAAKLSDDGSVREQALKLGTQWGQEILESAEPPHQTLNGIEPVEGFPTTALAVLHELGFKPNAEAPGCVRLCHCPQLQQAIASEGAVCALNEAMLQEVLRGTGFETEADQLQVRPCAVPGGCLVSIGDPPDSVALN